MRCLRITKILRHRTALRSLLNLIWVMLGIIKRTILYRSVYILCAILFIVFLRYLLNNLVYNWLKLHSLISINNSLHLLVLFLKLKPLWWNLWYSLNVIMTRQLNIFIIEVCSITLINILHTELSNITSNIFIKLAILTIIGIHKINLILEFLINSSLYHGLLLHQYRIFLKKTF